jgi:hypothetical protein
MHRKYTGNAQAAVPVLVRVNIISEHGMLSNVVDLEVVEAVVGRAVEEPHTVATSRTGVKT